jgi:predicted anti-sigma-YlaC factor YlaD
MMDCKEIEKEIYLYSELSATERATVDTHVHQCKSCKKLFDGLKSYHVVVQKIANDRPQPENFSRLTSSIMQAIDTPSNETGFSKFFERLLVRYAFMAASLLLVIFFFVEQQIHRGTGHQQIANTQSTTVTLNTSSVLQNLRKKKNSKGNTTSVYACLKSGDCTSLTSKTLN